MGVVVRGVVVSVRMRLCCCTAEWTFAALGLWPVRFAEGLWLTVFDY